MRNIFVNTENEKNTIQGINSWSRSIEIDLIILTYILNKLLKNQGGLYVYNMFKNINSYNLILILGCVCLIYKYMNTSIWSELYENSKLILIV